MAGGIQSMRGVLPRMAAELAVIVVGVLIALSADGWVSSMTDRSIEAARARALQDNVNETLARLEAAQHEVAAAREALRLLASRDSLTSTDVDQPLIDGLLYGPSFSPEMNVYDDLKSSGELALLKSSELRQALAKMDANFETVRLVQADLIVVQQLNLDPFIIAELNLGRLLGPYLGLDATPQSWSRSPGIERVRNLAVFKLDLISELSLRYDEAEAALRVVDVALHAVTSG